MFAQHTIDVRSTRTKLDRNREDWSEESWRLLSLGGPTGDATGQPELTLPAQTGSEHIQATGERKKNNLNNHKSN